MSTNMRTPQFRDWPIGPAPETGFVMNNVNGRVDLQDFIEFRQLFNAQGAAAASVPEPTGITLVMTGLVVFAAARQRKRNL